MSNKAYNATGKVGLNQVNQIIKADKKRINMLKENTVPLIYIFEMSRDI